jgi:hypothetical protein
MIRHCAILGTFALALVLAATTFAGTPPTPVDAPVPTDLDLNGPEPLDMACSVLPAQANDDYWTTSINTPITASPLANDPDNELQNFGGFTQPSHGTAEQVGLDAVKYTPKAGWYGTDSFNYTHRGCLQCSGGFCSEPDIDVGTVYITVNP